jgi:HD-like signal output (HDOD) protein/CheY-like chemotaxis protein
VTVKVLFVDDEESILSGLRRMLRRVDGWETAFAVGGEAALARIGNEDFDVVVTDMRMPVVDGAAVLDAVRSRHPGTVRIVLSGQNESAAALRTVPLAHQFLTKPCDTDTLITAVNRAASLQGALDRARVLPVIGGIDSLPSPPAAVARLTGLLAEPEVDMDAVIAVVGGDPAICAKLLQLVNSAFFGVARHIDDVGSAVRYLGSVTVRDLAVATHAFHAVTGGGSARALVEELNAHSVELAQFTQLLLPPRAHTEAYTTALLHDVGRLVLAHRAPEEYGSVSAEAAGRGVPLIDVEREAFGADHTEIGALFLSLWGLPFPMVEVVLRHHQGRTLPAALTIADAIHVADTVLGAGHSRLPASVPEGDDARLAEIREHPAVAEALRRWDDDGA